MKKLSAFLKNLLTVILSLALVVAAFELVLRLTPYKVHLLPVSGFYPQNFLRHDPVKGYDITPNFPPTPAYIYNEAKYDLWSNELGCFDLPADTGENSILVVGDSFSQGFAPYEDKWTTQLEQLVGQRVLKCGVAGYGTRQAFLKAKEIVEKLKKPPALILLGYYLNDLREDYLFPNYYDVFDGYLARHSEIKNLKSGEITTFHHDRQESYRNHSILWALFSPLLQNFSFPKPIEKFLKRHYISTENMDLLALYKNPWIQKAWDIHLQNLRDFKAYCAAKKIPLGIVIIPAREQAPPIVIDTHFGENFDLNRPAEILHPFLEQEKIPFLDLLPGFNRYVRPDPKTGVPNVKALYWKRDVHFNLEGNHLAGLLVAQFLIEKQLVTLPDATAKLRTIQTSLGMLDPKLLEKPARKLTPSPASKI